MRCLRALQISLRERLGDRLDVALREPGRKSPKSIRLACHRQGFGRKLVNSRSLDRIERSLQLLGPSEKERRTLEGGHVPSDYTSAIRETLTWYDKYLGPVR